MPHLAGRVRAPESRTSSAEAVVFPQLGSWEKIPASSGGKLGPSSGCVVNLAIKARLK